MTSNRKVLDRGKDKVFNLYVEPMWQDERYEKIKTTDKRMRILTPSKPQKEVERKVIITSPKP
jgi:hypothetical protein